MGRVPFPRPWNLMAGDSSHVNVPSSLQPSVPFVGAGWLSQLDRQEAKMCFIIIITDTGQLIIYLFTYYIYVMPCRSPSRLPQSGLQNTKCNNTK